MRGVLGGDDSMGGGGVCDLWPGASPTVIVPGKTVRYNLYIYIYISEKETERIGYREEREKVQRERESFKFILLYIHRGH